MSRVYNFSAGPAALPLEVLEQIRDELLDFHGAGMSVMEMSHRGRHFAAIAQQSESDLRELLAVPANYKVLFMQGGASAQFAAVPLNLTKPSACADYVNTGIWSTKAITEAKRYCKVNLAADAKASGYSTVPQQAEWVFTPDAAYVHYTPNETIGGVEFPFVPLPPGGVPLVADYSSSILSRPIDVSRHGVIYAGAQKNIGPAGLVVLIVREDLLGRGREDVPTVMNWTIMAAHDSMPNTPATFSWYVAGLVFQWLKRQGGLHAIESLNHAKASVLYSAIDASGFYRNPVAPGCRSLMNVPFTLPDARLDTLFLEGAAQAGLAGLQGHKLVGGMRASLYNAMPLAGVQALVAYMQEFQRRHG